MIKPSSVSYVRVSVERQRRYACVDGEAGKGGEQRKPGISSRSCSVSIETAKTGKTTC